MTTAKFLNELETAAYDLSKSVLIDAELFKYRMSITVASIISVVIEIFLKSLFEDRQKALAGKDVKGEKSKNLPVLSHIRLAVELWEKLLGSLFGTHNVSKIDEFGRYIWFR